MNIINLSAEPDWRLHTWLPHGLEAEQIVFLPDAYRNLDECLSLINQYVEEVARFQVVGYMGHL